MYFCAMREAPAFLGSHFAVGERSRMEERAKEREREGGGEKGSAKGGRERP